jgi:hypothetical protein
MRLFINLAYVLNLLTWDSLLMCLGGGDIRQLVSLEL